MGEGRMAGSGFSIFSLDSKDPTQAYRSNLSFTQQPPNQPFLRLLHHHNGSLCSILSPCSATKFFDLVNLESWRVVHLICFVLILVLIRFSHSDNLILNVYLFDLWLLCGMLCILSVYGLS
ncbi:uncharacterized protein LOC126621273 [Malus sylvestris]|uniref:uncharacterized protein LOC126621273 n=1 Tax=Malus sylvestris TaxID=3752 RepID=UPI0021AD156B|nr:uncharacterized protein LOC126621273 [Malus sylvestris]